jgi:hypothetical protein
MSGPYGLPTIGPSGSKYVNTAEWTLQQFRECVMGDEAYGYVIHDRDSIYLASRRCIEIDGLDRIENAIQIAPGECRLRTLQSAQRAESVCTMIPLNERHVR